MPSKQVSHRLTSSHTFFTLQVVVVSLERRFYSRQNLSQRDLQAVNLHMAPALGAEALARSDSEMEHMSLLALFQEHMSLLAQQLLQCSRCKAANYCGLPEADVEISPWP